MSSSQLTTIEPPDATPDFPVLGIPKTKPIDHRIKPNKEIHLPPGSGISPTDSEHFSAEAAAQFKNVPIAPRPRAELTSQGEAPDDQYPVFNNTQ